MTTIEINNNMTEQEENAVWFNYRPDFKMIDDNTGMIGDYAIIKFNERDPEDLESEKESAADICERYTNDEIMRALALMDYRKDDHFDRLPKYINEFNRSLKSGEPMDFYPFVKDESELRGYLEDEMITGDVDEYLESARDLYIYSPLGALFLNN